MIGGIRVMPYTVFLLVFAPRMLKFSRARFCAQAGVHAPGCSTHAGRFRAAAAELGAPWSHPRRASLFVFRSYRTQDPAKAARKPCAAAKDRPRADRAQEEAIARRAAAVGAQDLFRRAHYLGPDRGPEDGSPH